MFARQMAQELLEMAKSYPVVTLLGPRQSGKTTLVRSCFPKKAYVNLEDPEIRELAETDPRRFLEQFPEGGILDEVQRVPVLLSYIQVIVDERKEKGLFILTGSHQLELHQAISQSLSGRTALLTLLSMTLAEIELAGFAGTLDEAIFRGGYPRVFADTLDPIKMYKNYFATYIERDVRQLIQIKDLLLFQKFIRLCAGRIGQVLNMEGLAGEVGISAATVKHWLAVLEASFLIVRLPPYFANLGKRVIKSPKLYFTDVGLASYLLGIKSVEQVSRDPLRGNLVENLIVLELMKHRLNQGVDPDLWFFRDVSGAEVDLLFEKEGELVPIEIKAAETFHKEFCKGLLYFQKSAGERCRTGFVIYAGQQEQRIGDFQLLSYRHANLVFAFEGRG